MQIRFVEDRIKKLSLVIQNHTANGKDLSKLVDLLMMLGYPYDTVYEACQQAENALNIEILIPLTLQ